MAPAAEARLPQAVSDWLNKSGVLSPVIAREGFLWSEAEQKLYIPVHQYTSVFGPKLAGFVKRGFEPKYYRTIRTGSGPLWGLYRGEGGRGVQGYPPDGPLVAVESVLDALRVASAGYDALALCGTELHPPAASFILTEGYERAIVFLDGDNPTVQMKARTIANRLSWLDTRIIETGQDPKHYPEQKLKELLDNA